MEIKTLDISFCNKNALNLVNKEAKEYVMNKLQHYEIDMKHKYANIINKRSLRFLSLQPHLVSIKTSGSNYFLFFTRINEKNTCLFIDRKIKQGYTFPRIISVKYCFSDSIFNDTLIDGELIKDNDDNWMFLVGDIILYSGKKMNRSTIVEKYNLLYTMLDTEFNEDLEFDICPIRVKKLFSYKEYSKLLTQFMPSLSYKIRGLYFNTLNPKHCNHLFLYTDDVRKTKNVSVRDVVPIEQNHITSSSAKKEDNVFEIRTTNEDSIYEIFKEGETKGLAHISKMAISKKIRIHFSGNGGGLFMTCKFNTKFDKWEPI